ncbi:hypothetical protein [Roseateles amylovorans]|uniref:TonB C-terminal domain-containing protein n=1 Tax=Roseateles amylovorans TaxID=2978473 RepID=A0ABY6AUD9_9BURK|nr:hypothetical protein [Roseateles amylovorans]UXH76462.1 hypothetical protein N4261_15530 [Roseateles amylovorans]
MSTPIRGLKGAPMARSGRWAARLGLSLLLAGCGNQAPRAPAAPEPAAEPVRPSAPRPAPAPDLASGSRGGAGAGGAAPMRSLGAPLPVSTHEALRRQAAQRLVAANPDRIYMGEVPAVLLAIPVLEIELNRDGSVKHIRVLRRPGQAVDTIDLAIAAVHKAAPFGDVSRLPHPWKFNEVFLFNDDRRFKPRTLDE